MEADKGTLAKLSLSLVFYFQLIYFFASQNNLNTNVIHFQRTHYKKKLFLDNNDCCYNLTSKCLDDPRPRNSTACRSQHQTGSEIQRVIQSPN